MTTRNTILLCALLSGIKFGTPSPSNDSWVRYSTHAIASYNLKASHAPNPRVGFLVPPEVRELVQSFNQAKSAAPVPDSAKPSWYRVFLIETLVPIGKSISTAAAGALGTLIFSPNAGRVWARATAAVSPQHPVLQAIGDVSLAAATTTSPAPLNQHVVRRFIDTAAGQGLMPFFRSYPSHALSYGLGTASGWSLAEVTLRTSGRLLYSSCPVLDTRQYVSVLDSLASCMEAERNSTSVAAATNTNLLQCMDMSSIRASRIAKLEENAIQRQQHILNLQSNSSVLATELAVSHERNSHLAKNLNDCRSSLDSASQRLARAELLTDKVLYGLPARSQGTSLETQGVTVYEPRVYSQTRSTPHSPASPDLFFIKGGCSLGVTTTHLGGVDYYEGRATCRTVYDVGNFALLLLISSGLLQCTYSGYTWYSNHLHRAAVDAARLARLEERLTPEIRPITGALVRHTNVRH